MCPKIILHMNRYLNKCGQRDRKKGLLQASFFVSGCVVFWAKSLTGAVLIVHFQKLMPMHLFCVILCNFTRFYSLLPLPSSSFRCIQCCAIRFRPCMQSFNIRFCLRLYLNWYWKCENGILDLWELRQDSTFKLCHAFL